MKTRKVRSHLFWPLTFVLYIALGMAYEEFSVAASPLQSTQSPAAAQSLAQNQEDAFTLLRKLGFATLKEKPIDFDLPSVDGGRRRLSDYKGHWIWVSFWATWCGPCTYELPILESIHQEFKDQGLVLLGVSIDQAPISQVQKFLRSKNITFPNVHDEASQVSAQYQANSVPSIYVISPDWSLVGIFRGANDWENSSVKELLKLLLAQQKVPDIAARAGMSGSNVDKSVEQQGMPLPEELVPPKVKVQNVNDEYFLGEEITLRVAIEWPGNSERYLIKVPRIILPEGVEGGNMSSYTSSELNDQGSTKTTLIYEMPITVKKVGSYSFGPVELSYRGRQSIQNATSGGEQFARAQGVHVVIKHPWKRWGLIGLPFILLVAALGIFLYRKKLLQQKLQKTIFNEKIERSFKSEFLELQKRKISAGTIKYTAELVRLNVEWARTKQQLDAPVEKWEKLVDEIKYAGKILTTEEVAFFEKQLDRN